MPLMDGEETFERLRQMSPTANVVLMAGFVDSGRLGENDEHMAERICGQTVRSGGDSLRLPRRSYQQQTNPRKHEGVIAAAV